MGGFEDMCNEKNTREKRYCDALFNVDNILMEASALALSLSINNQALGQMFKSKNSVTDI